MNPFGEYAALRRFTRNLHQSQIFRLGNMLCWPDRLQPAKRRHSVAHVHQPSEVKFHPPDESANGGTVEAV